MRRLCGLLAAGLAAVLASCDQAPAPKLAPVPDLDPTVSANEHSLFLDTQPVTALPGWEEADLMPALAAFRDTCDLWQRRDPLTPLSRRASYGGTVGDWITVCDQARLALSSGMPRSFFETWFRAVSVNPGNAAPKLTGYYEPELKAYRAPRPGYDAPIPGLPDDLVTVDLGIFHDDLAGRKAWGKVEAGELVLYPPRGDIDPATQNPLGYGHPADVFFLQIQGSGRLSFEDGSVLRAAFAAHNHRPYVSLGNYLIEEGLIRRRHASMSGIRAWMDRVGPDAATRAMNVNPRYIFFEAQPVGDPSKGPKGAMGIPLTPMGSLAVDLSHHPLGVPIYFEGRIPEGLATRTQISYQSLAIAQDTGGAITGPVRGDLFFGWGDDAGTRAGSTNSDLRFWVLLPKTLEIATDD